MIYNFLSKRYEYEATKGEAQNATELAAMLAPASVKPSFTKLSEHIAGTRTSASIFTRSSGTWTVDALIGKIAVAFVNTDSSAFSINAITDNTATAVTIATTGADEYAAALLTSCDRICIFDSLIDANTAISFVAV